MSSSDPPRRLQDIIENADRIARHVHGLDVATFLEDEKTMDAVERCLARISEAAIKLGPEAESLIPSISWRDVRGIGNHLRHGYDAVNPARIWQTITEDLPLLRALCADMLFELRSRER